VVKLISKTVVEKEYGKYSVEVEQFEPSSVVGVIDTQTGVYYLSDEKVVVGYVLCFRMAGLTGLSNWLSRI
jgi:hypothetical protein